MSGQFGLMGIVHEQPRPAGQQQFQRGGVGFRCRRCGHHRRQRHFDELKRSPLGTLDGRRTLLRVIAAGMAAFLNPRSKVLTVDACHAGEGLPFMPLRSNSSSSASRCSRPSVTRPSASRFKMLVLTPSLSISAVALRLRHLLTMTDPRCYV